MSLGAVSESSFALTALLVFHVVLGTHGSGLQGHYTKSFNKYERFRVTFLKKSFLGPNPGRIVDRDALGADLPDDSDKIADTDSFSFYRLIRGIDWGQNETCSVVF